MNHPTEEEIERRMQQLTLGAAFGWTVWLIAVLALAVMTCGCAGVPPGNPGFNSCDVLAAGDYESRFAPSRLTQKDVEKGVLQVLDGATFTTDPRLNDQTDNCRKLVGYRVYTMPTENFIWPYDKKTWVSGFTLCLTKILVVGTPPSGNFQKSALVHEFFHALQDCEGIPPADPNVPSPAHENWHRDGIYRAIDIEWNAP